MPNHFGPRRSVLVSILLSAALAPSAASCASSEPAAPTLRTGPNSVRPDGSPYRATIRRTSFGIPHILAADMGSAGFGQGYALAQDHVCELADQIVKVKSQRARYEGPGNGDANIDSDFGYLAYGLYEAAKNQMARLAPAARELLTGYAEGFSAYVERTPKDALPPACRAAAWVQRIDAVDLLAHYMDLALLGVPRAMLPYAGRAAPPPAGASLSPPASSFGAALPSVPEGASNGWAIGKDYAEGARGLLLANPHFPWEGEMQLHESHITVKGQMNVYGAGLLGVAGVLIGFNENVAWTHTVSTATQSTIYKLTLSPGDPLAYTYDGAPRKMTTQTATIDVRGPGGDVAPRTRTLYSSHYGPIVSIPQVGWTSETAFALKSANIASPSLAGQYVRMNTARTLDEFVAAHREERGVPWVNTMYTDREGNAFYTDSTPVPFLSEAALAAFRASLDVDLYAPRFWESRIVMLDGANSQNEWVNDASVTPPRPAVPYASAPQLVRADYVFNANDSYWLANPSQPLTGFSPLFGTTGAPQSLRTRTNLRALTNWNGKGAAGPDGRLSRDDLKRAVLSNESILVDLARDALVARCKATPGVDVAGARVDVTEACNVLAAWDGRYDAASRGAVLFRETLAPFRGSLRAGGAFWTTPFDPRDPVGTPRDLAPPPAAGEDKLLTSLAAAQTRLLAAGFGLDVPLGDVQFTRRGDERIPVHGAYEWEGVMNQMAYSNNLNSTTFPRMARAPDVNVESGLTKEGYPMNYGTSFLMVLAFTDDGPKGEAILTYSESSDPRSAHYVDQTRLFATKALRPILFTEDEINADPTLQASEVTAPRPKLD